MLNIDPNKYANQRKRSSLKKHLFPEGMSYDEYMSQKNKKLQWDNKVEEIEIVKAEGDDLNKLQESNNPELGNVGEDLHFHKVHIEKKIVKHSMEPADKIPELCEENEANKEEKDAEEEVEVEIVKEKEIKFEEHHNTNFENKRKQSIKDEFSLAKDLLKVKITQNDEVDTDDNEETAKNTHLNECVGKDDDEESDH